MANTMIKHTGFQLLLQQMILLSGDYCIEELARKLDIPKTTFYHYLEGRATFPVDKIGTLYNETRRAEFVDFVVKDTDLMAVPRHRADLGKSIIEETLDVAAELGNVITNVRNALKDSDVDNKEMSLIIAAINKAHKELEELLLSIGNAQKVIVKVG